MSVMRCGTLMYFTNKLVLHFPRSPHHNNFPISFSIPVTSSSTQQNTLIVRQIIAPSIFLPIILEQLNVISSSFIYYVTFHIFHFLLSTKFIYE